MRHETEAKTIVSTLRILMLPVLLVALATWASSVDEAIVDTTAPTGAVELEPGAGAPITITCTVSGNQAGTATFEVNRDWTLSGGVFTGSNPVTFTVAPRAGGAAPNAFSTSGTIAIAAGQADGTFTLATGAVNITNSNSTGAKLSAGRSSNYEVTVRAPSPPSDTTPPTITPNISGTPGNNGWYISDVTVSWTVADGESEIVNVEGDDSVTINYDTNGVTLTCTATSTGGTASESVTIKRDATPPVVTITTPVDGAYYLRTATVLADWVAEDTTSPGSGLVLPVTATKDNRSAIDTSTVGQQTFSVTATDHAGNTTTETVTCNIWCYTFVGFLSPVENPQAVNAGKAGRTYPLKWQLKDYEGNLIEDDLTTVASTIARWANVSDEGSWSAADSLPETLTPGATILRYDSISRQYIFNWQTPKTAGNYVFVLTLNDGVTHEAYFRLTNK